MNEMFADKCVNFENRKPVLVGVEFVLASIIKSDSLNTLRKKQFVRSSMEEIKESDSGVAAMASDNLDSEYSIITGMD